MNNILVIILIVIILIYITRNKEERQIHKIYKTDMIKKLDIFFKLYEEVKLNNMKSFNHYETMIMIKNNILDDLDVSDIMSKYLKEIEFIQDDYIHKNGYNVNISVRNSIPPFNQYDEYSIF
jgi:hypothetical protein